jgi:hypothetical protein
MEVLAICFHSGKKFQPVSNSAESFPKSLVHRTPKPSAVLTIQQKWSFSSSSKVSGHYQHFLIPHFTPSYTDPRPDGHPGNLSWQPNFLIVSLSPTSPCWVPSLLSPPFLVGADLRLESLLLAEASLLHPLGAPLQVHVPRVTCPCDATG